MFLIRTALLVGLGVLLLPTDREGQAHVYEKAKVAVAWTVTFCDRNPATCQQGREGWAVFLKKAEFGSKMALDLIFDRNQRGDQQPQKPTPARAYARITPPQNRSLPQPSPQLSDTRPGWRGTVPRSGG